MASHQDEEKRRWHIGREIPVATIVILGLQTVAVVWWAASLAAKVESMDKATAVAQVTQSAVDRRQDDESVRAEARLVTQLDVLNKKLDVLLAVQARRERGQ